MKRRGSIVALIVMMAMCMLAVTASEAAMINVKDYSPRDVELDTTKTVSPGLPNVAIHTKVWLEAEGVADTNVVAWAVLTAPATSLITALDAAATEITSFTPDVVGGYQIELSVDATAADTVWINAGTWVGVGNIGDATPSIEAGHCAACHSGEAADWEMTKHADMLEEEISGYPDSHYASYCIGCHVVGADGDTTLANWNGGWDDWADSLNWTFPDTLIPANWDSLLVLPELANLANIQCESCHGPGSEHVGTTGKNEIAVKWDSGNCAVCHDSGTHHIFPEQLDNAAHSGSMHSDHYADEDCSYCHTTNGFVNETLGGAAHPAEGYGDAATSISCSACHDPHDATNTYQLRVAGDPEETCNSCHKVRDRYEGASLHYSIQGNMLAGNGGHEYSGEEYPSGHHMEAEDGCITCHMAELSTAVAAMADSVQFALGGHSFNIMTTVDDTVEVINDGGCEECHGATVEFLEMSQEPIQAMLDTLEAYLPTAPGRGGGLSVVSETDESITPAQKAAVTNWQFVRRDHSLGVHNHAYAAKLLMDSIEDMKATGDMPIISVSDVPDDQGKQVRVVWRAHPREGTVTDPVTFYHVWRQDPVSAMARPSADGGAIVSVDQLSDLASLADKMAPGSQAVVNTDTTKVWVYLASAPASELDRYGAVVPTIADSTVAAGQHFSVFAITATTAVPGMFYTSDPDSGYSLDNLAPTAPTSAMGSRANTGDNHLEWSEAIDADFNYFAIFRSDESGFSPIGMTSLGTTTGNKFDDTPPVVDSYYYYRIAAVDFSGNMGEYSDEIPVSPTSIGDVANLPKSFSLSQNFPNPFNPETSIQIGLPKDSMVRMNIYNITGQMVRSLLDQRMPAGYHKIKWDGRDNNGRTVNSGVYFYRISTDEFSQTRKMVLLK
ncbi:FlgD immunoglobulin-like domain containing protein [candidate division KSB1 bacterium]